MGIAVPLRHMWFKYMKIAVSMSDIKSPFLSNKLRVQAKDGLLISQYGSVKDAPNQH